MYGYTPIAITEKFCSAPPESRFSMPSSWLDSKICCQRLPVHAGHRDVRDASR